jgi:hypothetical protein
LPYKNGVEESVCEIAAAVKFPGKFSTGDISAAVKPMCNAFPGGAFFALRVSLRQSAGKATCCAVLLVEGAGPAAEGRRIPPGSIQTRTQKVLHGFFCFPH